MGNLVVTSPGGAAQAQPDAWTPLVAFTRGLVYINASGTGTGTWSATFNLAPVSGGNVIGSVRKFVVTNTVPMVDLDLVTGAQQFIGWWTNPSGTIANLIGSVDG